jgi:RNA polymerase sigma-70 factor (ECF subfamily)
MNRDHSDEPPRETSLEATAAPKGTFSEEAPEMGKLIEDFYSPLFRFALALTRNEADAADLAQQTFYLWAAKGHQLRDGTKVKSWLFTCLYREFLAQKRDQKNFVDTENVPEISVAQTQLAASAINQLDGEIAQKALLELDETYRAPLILFYLQEHSYIEIAEILEVPVGTVMSRIWRGKLKLRKKLLDRAGLPPSQRPIS